MGKIERTKNATRNIVFGIGLKIYQVLMPFIMRTCLIYFLGVQYLGLNSLFSSILQVLNLAELGVGSAMVFSMYKPIVEDDERTICALMRLYKLYYRIIGFIIAVVGVLLTPLVPKLISGAIPNDINIYLLYYLNLASTVLSYWLFAYKNSILQAHQRTDIVSKISLLTNTLQYSIQLLILIFLKNYYYYLLIVLVIQAMTNIITAICATKMYPGYVPGGKLPKEEVEKINQRIKDLFTSKVGGVVLSSADTIVVSAFLGLTTLAIYQNYYFILTSIIGFIDVVFNACMAGIGNSLIVESKNKNFMDLNKFTFIICWIASLCTCCFLNLYQPFMKIWVGKELMLGFPAVICLCIYFYFYEINKVLNTYKDAGGIWHEDRFRPLVTALSNLTMNLITVKIIGIYGVILSTVVATLFIGMPWLMHNLFSILFEKHQMKAFLLKICCYVITTIISAISSYYICNLIPDRGVPTLFFRLLICCCISNFFIVLFFHKSIEYKDSLILFDNMTKKKFKIAEHFVS